MDRKLPHKIKRTIQKTQFYVMFLLLVLAVGGYYFYQWTSEFMTVQDNIQQTTLVKQALANELLELKGVYPEIKADYQNQVVPIDKDFEAVFPSHEDYKNLARYFENYFNQHNTSNDPFILSSISFGNPSVPASRTTPKTRGEKVTETSAAYSILPVNISFSCSEKRFVEFFDFIQDSGSLEDKSRLMSIDSFETSLGDEEEEEMTDAEKNLGSYSLSIKAYFQKSILGDS